MLLGCAGKPEAQPQSDDPNTLSSLRLSINQALGDRRCSSVDVCRSIPYGAKPCGGPRSYLVYSIITSDSVRLMQDVRRYNEAEARLNEESGEISDCSLVSKPGVECSEGRCKSVR